MAALDRSALWISSGEPVAVAPPIRRRSSTASTVTSSAATDCDAAAAHLGEGSCGFVDEARGRGLGLELVGERVQRAGGVTRRAEPETTSQRRRNAIESVEPTAARQPHRSDSTLAASELVEMLLDQTMNADPLQLGGEDQDLIGGERVLFVENVEDALERGLELGIRRRGRRRHPCARASAASCMIAGS